MKNIEQISIGQFAKEANVSIRTLQYYDRIGLLKPSFISEGGRRFYQKSDMALLHQIITLKSLGLSLDEIKNRVMPVKNSKDVSIILAHQQKILKEQISKAQKILQSIEMIKNEIEHSNIVDWSKYAMMMELVQENNDYYWISNYLDQDIINKIAEVHKSDIEQNNPGDWLKSCLEKAINLDESGISPTSEEAQKLVGEWWYYINQYTNGNEELMKKLNDFYCGESLWPAEFGEIQRRSQGFMKDAIHYYLAHNGLL